MPPKRKPNDDMGSPAKKKKGTIAIRGGRKENNDAYTAQQKAAITQFMNFAQTDRNAAIRHLKSNGWDPNVAVNSYFSGGGGSSASSGTKNSLNKIFDGYREDVKNAPDSVGPEGAMKYFGHLGVDVENLEVLAVLEIVQGPTMGEMSREGFVEGWTALNCDTLDKQKSHIKNLKKALPTNIETFTKVYKYTFQLAKTGNQKAIPLDTALTYWELLFTSPQSAVKWSSPSSPWFKWWAEFLNSQWKKSVNKDMWNETLKFVQLTLQDEAMSFWNEDSSWPSVIDEFVEWVKKEKRGGETVDAMEE